MLFRISYVGTGLKYIFSVGASAVLYVTLGLRAPPSVVTLTFLNHCHVEEIMGNFTMYLINYYYNY